MAEQALSHVKVIDLTHHVAGPYCTKLMAGFGAEVIKVERPQTGDALRSVGPFYEGEQGLERGIPFLWLNTGKKSVTLDLKTDRGADALKRLVRQADVLVENFMPTVKARLGLDYETLRRINPRLVMTSISNFGQTGPYRDYEAEEITEYALSGSMYLTGDPVKPPLASGPAITQNTAGMWAYIATLGALLSRAAGGGGQHVDLSIQESAMDNIEIAMAEFLHAGKTAKRKNDRHPMVPWELFPCQDGQVAVIGGPIRHWLRAAGLFEEPRMFDKKLEHAVGRIEHRDEFEALLRPWLASHKKEEIFHAGQERKLAFGYLASLGEALESPQHASRGFFVGIDHPEVGHHRYAGPPFRLSETPWQSSRAPRLGEHNQAILGALVGHIADEGKHESGEEPDSAPRLPLSGVCITDLTHYWSGPHATRILADLGADVIRVENATRLCVLRGAYVENDAYNRHPRWHQVNRNKRSVTLDLKNARDRGIIEDLVKISDVVAENSRPGVMSKLGLGYEDLRKLRPDLIMLSVPACGSSGPWAPYAGVGGSLEPLSGLQALTAYERDGKRMRIKEADVTSGILGACAVMTALLFRRQTGRGQWVDVSQLEALSHTLMGEHLLEYVMNGTQTLPVGSRSARFAPQGCYRCKGDDKWVVLTIRSDAQWRQFCDLLRRPEWTADPRFSTCQARRRNHDEVDRWIESWTSTRSHYEVMQLLQARGIPAGAVLDTAELSQSAHLRARRFFRPAADGTNGLFAGFPGARDEWGDPVRRRGADLGVDNRSVVSDLLGRSEEDVPRVDKGEIGTGFDPE